MVFVRLHVSLLLVILAGALPLHAQDFPAAAYRVDLFVWPNANGQEELSPTDVEEGGKMSIATSYHNASLIQPTHIHSVGGTPTAFSCPGAHWTVAQGINRHGAIAGWCYTHDGTGQNPVITGFYRDAAGKFTSLVYPGATMTEAADVNNHGNVTGFYTDVAGQGHGFFWKPSTGKFTSFDVPYPGSSFTTPVAMNNADVIVGFYYAPIIGQAHGFQYNPRTGLFAGIDAPEADSTVMLSINDHNVAIGGASNFVTGGYAFLYEGGTFTPFVLPFQTAGRLTLTAINNSERIVGTVEEEIPSGDPTGDTPPTVITRGFLATPLPPPLATAQATSTQTFALRHADTRQDRRTMTTAALPTQQPFVLAGCPGDGVPRPGKLLSSWALCR